MMYNNPYHGFQLIKLLKIYGHEIPQDLYRLMKPCQNNSGFFFGPLWGDEPNVPVALLERISRGENNGFFRVRYVVDIYGVCTLFTFGVSRHIHNSTLVH